MESKNTARLRREDKMLGKQEKQEAKAAKHIGELQKANGSTHYYVSHPACTRHFESENFYDCVEYLVRNKYVRA